MAYDYSQKKIEIFPGINDVPRQATATEAENGSDHAERINTVCDNLSSDLQTLETAIADVQSQVDGLSGGDVSDTTLNVTINQSSSWFNSPSNVYILVIFVPFEYSLLENDSGTKQVIDLYFGNFGSSYINNNSIGNTSREQDNFIWTINDFSTPANLGNFIDRWGKGYYVFLPLNEAQGAYSTDYYLPDNGSNISITVNNLDKECIDIFDLNIFGGGFIRVQFSLAMNSPLNDGQYIQALKINDTLFECDLEVNAN